MGWGITKRVPPDKSDERDDDETKINKINETIRTNKQTLAKRLEGVKWLFGENGEYRRECTRQRGSNERERESVTEEARHKSHGVKRQHDGRRTQGSARQTPREKRARISTYKETQLEGQGPDQASVVKSGRVRNPDRPRYPEYREWGGSVSGPASCP